MLLLTFTGLLALTHALPTQQILTPAATLAAIPATNHILILTPQAQVQLEPSLKFAQPLIHHLAPVARIDSPTDQTVVYFPKENLNNAFSQSKQQAKQNEPANLTNIVNQFLSAGLLAQAQLEAFQNQLTQGLESLIQPGQKTEGDKDSQMGAMKSDVPREQLIETPRQDGGRFYSVSDIPQFYSNFEILHTPVNPLYTIHPYQAIRARSVTYPDEKVIVNVPQESVETLNLAKIVTPIENQEIQSKLPEGGNLARGIDLAETLTSQQQPELAKGHIIPNENEQLPANSNFGKYLGSLEKSDALQEDSSNREDLNILMKEKKEGSELVSFAEAIPAGLAISGEGGLSQTKPIGSAIVGKDGVAYSAPSGTAIAGANNDGKNIKSS